MKSQIKSSIMLSYIQTFISVILSFIISPITIRLLGQSEFGIYSLAGSIIPYLTLLDLGFSNAIVRYITEYRVKNKKEKEYALSGMFFLIYSIIGLVVLVIGTLIVLNSSYIFSNSLTSNEIIKVKIMMLISTFYIAISFPFKVFDGIIIAYEKFLFVRLIALVTTFVTPIITIVLLFSGKSSIELTLLTAIIGLISSIAEMIYCIKVLNTKLIFKKFELSILKELFSYSFYIFLASIVDVVYWNADILILGMVSNSKEVAVYSVASKLNQYFSSFTMVISGFLLPKVVKLVTENKSNREILDLFIKVSRIQLQIVGLIILGFIFIGEEFIIIWAGPNYKKAYVIALLLMSIRIIPICQVLGTSILQAKDKHKLRAVLYLIVSLLNLVISIPLGKLYGGLGCAIGTAIGLSFNIVIINIYYHRLGLDMKIYWSNFIKLIIPIIMTGIIGIFISRFIVVKSILSMSIFIIIFSAIYGIILWFFGTNDYERQLMQYPIKKLFLKK